MTHTGEPSLPITNIRYAADGKIAFTYKGREFLIKEPEDVILVNTNAKAANQWIIHRYGFLLY